MEKKLWIFFFVLICLIGMMVYALYRPDMKKNVEIQRLQTPKLPHQNNQMQKVMLQMSEGDLKVGDFYNDVNLIDLKTDLPISLSNYFNKDKKPLVLNFGSFT